MPHVTSQLQRRFRRVVAALACTVLLGAGAACTNDDQGSRPEPVPEPTPSRSVGSAATLEPKPVPLTVRVTRVSGKFRKAQFAALERKVGKAISGYFDAAWLGGDYPRNDFRNVFPTFSREAAALARRDRELTTNAVLGRSIESITPKRKTARLSVLAPNKVALGVTAQFRLEFVAELAEAAPRRVSVSGQLLLTRKKGGEWQIFGYDVARSESPAGKGAR